MNRISEYFETFLAVQLAQLVTLVVEKKSKVVSIIVPENNYKAIITILAKSVVKYRAYNIESFKFILMSLDEKNINIIEEVNNSAMSRDLKEFIIREMC